MLLVVVVWYASLATTLPLWYHLQLRLSICQSTRTVVVMNEEKKKLLPVVVALMIDTNPCCEGFVRRSRTAITVPKYRYCFVYCILYTPIWHFRKRRPIEFLPTTYDCNNPPQLTHFNVRHVNAFSTSTQPSLINNSNPLFRLPQWCCWWIPEEVLQALTLKSTPSARSI